ncbi:hypothetical protein RHODO2019_06760 [Rhodococcus antarcticus]|uniref:AMP-dependent synthetase/ligase domain-containing protein n=1 Tax=Rhodococcus antarcticus TaxID=2987751 RepID=A0ABY6P382_9NOCA|nr:AMP-binding protein [Rhodococcus antarcticus]UZJ26110.1 hypothetical protein RHODO2019_06760 [Rhodococcus antarcticus]
MVFGRGPRGRHVEGLRKGDVLALHGPSSLAVPVVLLAAARLGVTVTTLNGLCTTGEMAVQLRDRETRRAPGPRGHPSGTS